jgi:hypothetical protein
MLSELLNRKSASRSSRVPFHVVSLIPRAGFQKHFTVSVLQSYAPFNVGVFRRWGQSSFSQNMCVLHQPAVDPQPGRGGSNVASRLGGWGPGRMQTQFTAFLPVFGLSISLRPVGPGHQGYGPFTSGVPWGGYWSSSGVKPSRPELADVASHLGPYLTIVCVVIYLVSPLNQCTFPCI